MLNLFLIVWIVVLLQFGAKLIQGTSLEKNVGISWNHFFSLTMEMEYETLRKTHLRVYASNAPPGFEIVRDPKSQQVRLKGLAVDLVEYIAQHLDWTLEYVIENSIDVEKYGSIEAATKALINKEVDLVLVGLIPSPERAKIFDLTCPLMYDDYRIMVKWPEEMDRWTEVARPFDSITWSLIAVTIVLMIGMTTLISLFINGGFNRKQIMNYFGANTMYIIGIMTNQGDSETTRRLSLRILLGSWLLMMVVLINSYTGTLTSHMTVPKWKPIPQSLEELADMNKDYQMAIIDHYQLGKYILNASSGPYKILGDSLREHPDFLFKKYSDATNLVLKQKGANVETAMVISFRITMDYKRFGKCRFTASNLINHFVPLSGALAKDSPFTKTVEKEMQRAREMGLNTVWRKNHVPSIDKCMLSNQDKDRKPTPIPLAQISSAFVVLGVGIAVAALTFIMEIIYSFLLNGQKN